MVVVLLWTTVIIALGLKVAATLILLARPAATRLADRRGLWLWWTTKITPVLAVPCMIAIALIEHDRSSVWGFSAMMVFVAIAVPLAIWRRFGRDGQQKGPGITSEAL